MVLRRLVLFHRRLVSWPSTLCRDAGHRRRLLAFDLDAAGDGLVLALDGLVEFSALVVGGLFGGFFGGLEACAYAVCIALLGGFGEVVLLQRFLRFGVEV